MTSEAEGKATERVLDEIFAERARQRDQKGYTPEEDDKRTDGMLAVAGAHRALAAHPGWVNADDVDVRRRDLVEAAALLVAEIERLDRAEQGKRA